MADSFAADSFIPDSARSAPSATPASAPTPKADSLTPVVGGIADTLGLTDRPGARNVAQVLMNPEGTAETVASTLAKGGAIGAAGGGLGLVAARLGAPLLAQGAAQIAGRVGAAGATGAGAAALRGEDPFWGGVIDAAVAGILGEGGAKVLSSGMRVGPVALGLKEWGAPARAFAEAPAKAVDAFDIIKSRLPAGNWFNVPSLGAARMSAQDAIAKLAEKTGAAYVQARAELASELSRLDMQRLTGPNPLAGALFKRLTPAGRETASSGARLAESARKALGAQSGRTAMDTAATHDIGGAPAGAVPFLLGGVPGFGSIAHRLAP